VLNGLFVLHPILGITYGAYGVYRNEKVKSKQSKVPKFLILTNKIGGDK
jgi:hypothetical protein